MLRRKMFSSFLCLSLIMTLLLACSNNAGNNKANPSESTKEEGAQKLARTYKVLVVAENVGDYTDPITGAKLKGWETLVKPLEDKNPGLNVEFVQVPWDGIEQKWQTAAETGEFDVLHLSAGQNNNYGARGYLTPLEEFVEKDKDFDPIQIYGEGSWDSDALQLDGIHYGLPKSGYSSTIVLNKKIFDDFGVDYITENSTWEEILEKAKQLTGKNPKTGVNTYGFYTGQGWGIFPYLQNYFNKELYSYLDWRTDQYIGGDLKTLNWKYANNPGIEKAYEWFKEMANYMPPGWNTSQGAEKFFLGDSNLAMNVTDGAGNFKRLYNAGEKELLSQFGVVPLPAFTNKDGKKLRSVGNYHTWAIPKGSKNKEAAWEIIKYLSSKDLARLSYEETWASPVFPEAKDWIIPEDPYSNVNIQALQDSHGYAKDIYLSAYNQFYTMQVDLLANYSMNKTKDIKAEIQKIQDFLDSWTDQAIKNGTR